MVFSDTSTKLGLIQNCETKVFGDDGYGQISGNTNRLYQFTERLNRAQDRFVYLAMSADGRWQYDDTNNTDYPIATTALVSGQRDYTFALEHLEIEKVLILHAATNGQWTLLHPFDQDDPSAQTYLENNTGNTGIPFRYDKKANSIFLDPVPNYSVSAGLKIYFKRGPNYFVYTDTTKVPGFASIFHDYLSLHASTNYAVDRNLANAANLNSLLEAKEASIIDFFARRNRDEQLTLSARSNNSR